ncbi:MAG: restriction endonuclease [Candidatus Bathyarchaeota archaeon]|nr:restriction endonuclease [Candidatus Bathyarchaeota archaeon]MDH5595215.1 restriction endonuclease [Candidatus Bathyarchaeota archaeon]
MTKSAPPILTEKISTKEELHQLLNDALKEKNKTKKGWKFEIFFENLMQREKDFRLVFRHPRSELGEIDYVYSHDLQDHYFWKVSPYICIECKNWKENITSTEINHLAELIREKGPLSCCGVYITSSSYSPSAIEAINHSRLRDEIVVVPIEGKHLASLIAQGFKDFIQKLCEEKIFKKTG